MRVGCAVAAGAEPVAVGRLLATGAAVGAAAGNSVADARTVGVGDNAANGVAGCSVGATLPPHAVNMSADAMACRTVCFVTKNDSVSGLGPKAHAAGHRSECRKVASRSDRHQSGEPVVHGRSASLASSGGLFSGGIARRMSRRPPTRTG